MNERQFQCAVCGGVFKCGWSDEEAKAELLANFGEVPTEDQAVVCDDCYDRVKIVAILEALGKTDAGQQQ